MEAAPHGNRSHSAMAHNCSDTNASVCPGTDDEAEVYTDLSGYVVPGIFAVIFLVGVVGNGTLIFIVLRNKVMQTTPNIFIVSLAFGDLLLLLVSVPFFAFIYTYHSWPFGEFVCKLNGFLKALSLGVSVFTLTALSADRYSAIKFPMRRHIESPVRRNILIAAGIWLLAVGFAMFEGTIIHVSELQWGDSEPIKVCHSHPAHWGTWFRCFRAWIRFLVYFLIPILVIGVLYSLMACSLWQSQSALDLAEGPPLKGAGQGAAVARQAEARKKVAKLVLSIVVLFIVCWLPTHIYLLWFQCPSQGDYNMFWHVWKILSYCLSFVNSCLNPLALCILSHQFRRYFLRYLCCRKDGAKPPKQGAKHLWKTSMYNKSHSELSTEIINSGPTSKTFM